MVYTEIKERNGKKYYYRVVSLRNGKKVSKKRMYLGEGLSKSDLIKKEMKADEEFLVEKKKKINKELEQMKKKIIKVLKKYNVKRAGIFGSYARGEQKKNSDVDILVQLPKRMGFGFVGIELELEDKLSKKVDLLTYGGIHPLIKKNILEDEVRII